MLIAINGVDGVGKSQQIRLLQFYNGENLNFTKPLIEYSSKWPKLKSHDMFNWWFKKVNIEEFVNIIIESLNTRYLKAKNSVVILDRGTLMFKAVCAATISARTESKITDSIERINISFAQGLNYKQEEEHNILLLPDAQYQKSITPYLSLLQNDSDVYTEEEDEFYLIYQGLLREAVAFYFREVVDRITVDSSICEIQNKLRLLIGNITKQFLPEICGGVKQVIGFGGLSECGKSSFAEHFYKNKGYYRLKLGYFVEILKRHGKKDTPENVAMEFLHFCKLHYYVEKLTLESLHEPYTPACLKLMFGSKFKIAYLDAPFNIRRKRASIEQNISLSEAENITKRKDQVKKDRGAKIVGKIADINFDNSKGEHYKNILKFEKTIVS